MSELKKLEDAVQQLVDVQDARFKQHDGDKAELEAKFADQALFINEANQKLANLEAFIERQAVNNQGDSQEVKAAEEYLDAVKSYLVKAGSAGINAISLMNPDEVKVLAAQTQPGGGYLVPQAMSSTIISRVFETSPLRQVAKVESLTNSDKMTFLIDDNEYGAGWVGETETRAATSEALFGRKEITAHELYAWPEVTLQLLEDSGIDIAARVALGAADKFSRLENTAFCSGLGVNSPRGFLTYAAGTSTYARDQIERVVSGHASTLTGDGVINLQGSLKEAYQAKAVFGMKRSAFNAVRVLKDTANQYLLGIGIGGLNNAQQLQILGKPVIFMDDMPAVGAGTLPLVYGDFSVGYTILDRVGMSLVIDPYSSTAGAVKYKFRKRTGGDVTNYEALKLQVVST